MGKVVIPKHTADLKEILSALKIYYEADGAWVTNPEHTRQLKELIGGGQYPSSYPKKAQFLTYYGFTEWNPEKDSERRITKRGKAFYEHYISGDQEGIWATLAEALEEMTFGRNNNGVSSSDSDVEPPCLLLRAPIDLEHITNREYSFLLWHLAEGGGNYTDVKEEILHKRSFGISDFPEECKQPAYADLKIILFLVRLDFLQEGTAPDGKKCVMINPAVKEKYGNRLAGLKIYNVDKIVLAEDDHGKQDGDDSLMIENSAQMKKTKKLPVRAPRTRTAYPLNCILYGAPGTGKTYATAQCALAIVESKPVEDVAAQPRTDVMARYNRYIEDGRIIFTTFHQSYAYEDFIQGMRPDPLAVGGGLHFKTVDGVFKELADRAFEDPDNDYVIIIDEINRANISKVFGELITLIEEDKRWGEMNAIRVTLPSGDVFAVPNNLYIVGTMNSADKSISLIDTALRRRFAFIEHQPKPELIQDDTLRKALETLNKGISEELRSTDLLIGHAYFINKTAADLEEIMNRNIIPLLYEYFFDDRKKVLAHVNKAIEGLDLEVDANPFGRVRVRKKGSQ